MSASSLFPKTFVQHFHFLLGTLSGFSYHQLLHYAGLGRLLVSHIFSAAQHAVTFLI